MTNWINTIILILDKVQHASKITISKIITVTDIYMRFPNIKHKYYIMNL